MKKYVLVLLFLAACVVGQDNPCRYKIGRNGPDAKQYPSNEEWNWKMRDAGSFLDSIRPSGSAYQSLPNERIMCDSGSFFPDPLIPSDTFYRIIFPNAVMVTADSTGKTNLFTVKCDTFPSDTILPEIGPDGYNLTKPGLYIECDTHWVYIKGKP